MAPRLSLCFHFLFFLENLSWGNYKFQGVVAGLLCIFDDLRQHIYF